MKTIRVWYSLLGALTLLVALAVCVPRSAVAQAISGDIVGTVGDKTGAVVPGAQVTVVNVATGVSAALTTNANGNFHFVNLLVGKYYVTASASGFASTRVDNLVVSLNQTASISLSLDPAAAHTTVKVTEAGVTLDTTDAHMQTSYSSQQINGVPLASRGSGVLNMSLLDAGVALTGGLGVGSGGPSVNGQRPYNNNYTVEGLDNNNKNNPGPEVSIPNDAIASFTVLQSQFSPEFGHSNGGQFNEVIKSGTNDLHGMLYEYFQNRHLIAVNNGAGQKNPRYDNNRFGGNVGGPILKNKLFYFENIEYNPVGTVGSSANVNSPTADGFTILKSLPGLSQTNLGTLQKYLPPGIADPNNPQTITVSGTTIPVGTLSIGYPSYSNNFSSITSVDYSISHKDSLRVRYIYARSYSPDTSANLSVFWGDQASRNHLVNISEYHLFSPNVNNEARLGYSHLGSTDSDPSVSFPGLDAFPSFNFSDLNGLQFGPNTNVPNGTIINTYSAIDNLSVQRGNHALSFGVEGRKYISPQSSIERRNGDYEYQTLDTYLHDLSPDYFGERSGGVSVYYGDQIGFYTYANDVWRATEKLTINMGMRYEYTTVPYTLRLQELNEIANVPGLITFGEPKAPKANFMPRVGFAWAPDWGKNTSIRGGLGVGYDVFFDNIAVNLLPPELHVTSDTNPNIQTPDFLASGGLPGGAGPPQVFPTPEAARAATSAVAPEHILDPRAVTWNFGVQHSFKKDYLLEVRYVGVRSTHENYQTRVNKYSLVNSTNYLPTYSQNPSQATLDSLPLTLADLQAGSSTIPAYTSAGFTNTILAYQPLGSSIYHGLQTQLNKRMSNGLQFQAAWTWSRTIDNSTTDFFSTYLTPRRAQDFDNLEAERSVSGYSRANRVTVAVWYSTPWFRASNNWALKNLLSNFAVGPVYTFESPEWADVQSADDANFNGDSAGDRAIYNPNGVKGTGSDVTPLQNTNGDTVAYLENNPDAEYIRARPGAHATSSRNTLEMNHINNFDASITKNLDFTARLHFQLTAQIYNLLNHRQYVPGQLNDVAISQATQGQVLNYLTPGQPNFNSAKDTFGSQPRSIQLVAKFSF